MRGTYDEFPELHKNTRSRDNADDRLVCCAHEELFSQRLCRFILILSVRSAQEPEIHKIQIAKDKEYPELTGIPVFCKIIHAEVCRRVLLSLRFQSLKLFQLGVLLIVELFQRC
jgi:hypothetical protein